MRLTIFIVVLIMVACSKKDDTTVSPGAESFSYQLITINGLTIQPFKGITVQPTISVKFSAPLNKGTARGKIKISTLSGLDVLVNLSFASSDSIIVLSLQSRLECLTRYKIKIDGTLTSANGRKLSNPGEISFYT